MKLFLSTAAAVALMATSAVAAPANVSDEATLNLQGELPAVCYVSFGGNLSISNTGAIVGAETASATSTVNLTQGRLTNQQVGGGTLEYGCNAPFKLSFQSQNGGLIREGGSPTVATDRMPYGINFNGIPTGASGGAAGYDQYELGLTRTTPAVIDTRSWAVIGTLGNLSNQLNVEVDLGVTNSAVGLAGVYKDTIKFKIESTM